MSSKPSLYSGGYNSLQHERLDRVTIPDKVKCCSCQRNRTATAFSGNQLRGYKQSILRSPQNPKLPKCSNCVGGAGTHELKCHRCELTKGLDSFAKTHRRNPDHALCKDCQQEVSDVEPNIEDALQEQQILDTQTSIGSHSLQNTTTAHTSLPNMSSRTGASDIYSGIGPPQLMGSGVVPMANGVWMAQNLAGQPDQYSLAPSRSNAPSIAASEVSASTGTAWDNFSRQDQSYRSRIEPSQASRPNPNIKNSDKWAKPEANKPDRGALRAAEEAREARRKVQEQERSQLDDESSGSDWEL